MVPRGLQGSSLCIKVPGGLDFEAHLEVGVKEAGRETGQVEPPPKSWASIWGTECHASPRPLQCTPTERSDPQCPGGGVEGPPSVPQSLAGGPQQCRCSVWTGLSARLAALSRRQGAGSACCSALGSQGARGTDGEGGEGTTSLPGDPASDFSFPLGRTPRPPKPLKPRPENLSKAPLSSEQNGLGGTS